MNRTGEVLPEEGPTEQLREEIAGFYESHPLPPTEHVSLSLECIEAFLRACAHKSLEDAANSANKNVDTFRKRLDVFERWSGLVLFQRRPTLIMTPDAANIYGDVKEAYRLLVSVRDRPGFSTMRRRVGRNPKDGINGSMRRSPLPSKNYINVD